MTTPLKSLNKPLTMLPIDPSYELACKLVDDDNVELWRDIATKIADNHDIKIESLQKISGWANVLLIVNDDIVIKIIPPNWISQGRREVEALELIKGHALPVATPQLMATSSIDNWLYVVMNKLPGSNLDALWNNLDEDNQALIIKQVAKFANALHQIKLPASVKDSELYHNWPDFIKSQTVNCYEKHKHKKIPKHLLDLMEAFLDTHEHQSHFETDILMHTDLHPGNLMVEKHNGQWHLSAVIDFGDALIGPDKYFEYATSAMLMGLGNAKLNQALLDTYDFEIQDIEQFQNHLMALSLLRHMGGVDYIIERFPGSEKLPNWEQMAKLFFKLD